MTGYADIAAHFRQQIEEGALAPGDRLPAVRDVMAQFGVAQQTASRAYKELRSAGLTSATTGGGTVVADRLSENVSSRVQTYARTGRALSGDETSEIIGLGKTSADERIAARLGVEAGTPVFVRRRLVKRGGTPVHVSSSYYPDEVIAATPELTKPVSTGGSRELAAERLGAPQGECLEEVTARLATADEAAVLDISGLDIVIVTEVIRTVWLTDNRVVEVAVKISPGAKPLRWITRLD